MSLIISIISSKYAIRICTTANTLQAYISKLSIEPTGSRLLNEFHHRFPKEA
jgi:hypothetical protein